MVVMQLCSSGPEDAAAIRNLYPLYLHDVSAYERKTPNRHGVLAEDDSLRTWGELLDRNGVWWERPGVLFPYLIRVDGLPVGFDLIASGPYVPTAGVDFVVYEFFVVHAFRGTGIAAAAAQEGIRRHRGTWEVATWPKAARARAFWRKTLPPCARGEVRETEEDHPWGERVVFRFDNRE